MKKESYDGIINNHNQGLPTKKRFEDQTSYKSSTSEITCVDVEVEAEVADTGEVS